MNQKERIEFVNAVSKINRVKMPMREYSRTDQPPRWFVILIGAAFVSLMATVAVIVAAALKFLFQ